MHIAWSWPTETRHLVALMLCLVNAICYADRTNIGIAAPVFIPDEVERGIVLSAFFYGYLLMQIPSSIIAKYFGVKLVLAVGVLIWTVFDVSTVFVSSSIPALFLVRAMMGFGEGVVFPSIMKFSTNWFPISERSTMVAVIFSGSDLGTISALLISPFIMKVSHWTAIFLIFGAMSGIILTFFLLTVTSSPEQHPRISQAEKNYILATRGSDQECTETPCKVLLFNKSLWVIYIALFCHSYSWYVLLGWIPSYFNEELKLDLKDNKLLVATPYMFGYCGMIASGIISDRLVRQGYHTLHVRRIMSSIGTFFPAFFLYLLRHVKAPSMVVLLLSATLFTGRISVSSYCLNMIDLGPNNAGQVMGVSNTFGTIAGILCNLVTGYILKEAGSWNMVFTLASVLLCLGGVIFLFFSTVSNAFIDEEDVRVSDTHQEEMNAPFLEP